MAKTLVIIRDLQQVPTLPIAINFSAVWYIDIYVVKIKILVALFSAKTHPSRTALVCPFHRLRSVPFRSMQQRLWWILSPSSTKRRIDCVSRVLTAMWYSMWLSRLTLRKMSKKRKSKSKVTWKDIAWWTYFVIMIALVIFGFWNSETAEVLLRAIREAFSLLME